MQQEEIHQYLEQYFKANKCQITDNQRGYLTVQLTAELDKELMNRPFYWHYLEKIGGTPQPMSITLITDPDQVSDDVKGEKIHFGSPRLHQIFQSTKKNARYIRLYEQKEAFQIRQRPLYPWLCLNVNISYQCDKKRNTLRSLGLSLINGMLVENFHHKIKGLTLTRKMPDYCFTLSPIIMPGSAIRRLETFLREEISAEDHTWAEEAKQRLREDMNLLDHFYEEMDEKPEAYEIEKKAIQEQYEPKIKIDIINGGLFYLTSPVLT